MLQVFKTSCYVSFDQSQTKGLLRLWIRTIIDLFITAIKEHFFKERNMRSSAFIQKNAWLFLLVGSIEVFFTSYMIYYSKPILVPSPILYIGHTLLIMKTVFLMVGVLLAKQNMSFPNARLPKIGNGLLTIGGTLIILFEIGIIFYLGSATRDMHLSFTQIFGTALIISQIIFLLGLIEFYLSIQTQIPFIKYKFFLRILSLPWIAIYLYVNIQALLLFPEALPYSKTLLNIGSYFNGAFWLIFAYLLSSQSHISKNIAQSIKE